MLFVPVMQKEYSSISSNTNNPVTSVVQSINKFLQKQECALYFLMFLQKIIA